MHLVPAARPGHKKCIGSYLVRYEALAAAVQQEQGLQAMPDPCGEESPSYTATMMASLLEQGAPNIVFAVGDEAAAGMSGWYKADKLSSLMSLIVYTRTTGTKCMASDTLHSLDFAKAEAMCELQSSAGRYIFADWAGYEASSTQIRTQCRNQAADNSRTWQRLVPPPSLAAITTFYRSHHDE